MTLVLDLSKQTAVEDCIVIGWTFVPKNQRSFLLYHVESKEYVMSGTTVGCQAPQKDVCIPKGTLIGHWDGKPCEGTLVLHTNKYYSDEKFVEL